MQVYFIDNDDYFHRKAVFTDPESGEFFKDNDERAIFFARGILETVKKLRWKPDLIHCQGWISNLLPIYLKKAYKEDPIFAESKVVLSLYDEFATEEFSPKMKSKVILPGIRSRDLDLLNTPNGINLAKLAVQYSDGIILGSPSFNPEEILQFEGQTKGKLGTPQAKPAVESVVAEKLTFWLEENREQSDMLIRKMQKAMLARIAARKARDEARRGKRVGKGEKVWKKQCPKQRKHRQSLPHRHLSP